MIVNSGRHRRKSKSRVMRGSDPDIIVKAAAPGVQQNVLGSHFDYLSMIVCIFDYCFTM